MATTDSYREFSRRQHRALAAYLVLECWRQGTDFVVLNRLFLEHYLGLERFKSVRKEWLREDFESLFPEQREVSFSQTQGKFASIFFSRKSFPDGVFAEPLTDEERVQKSKELGLAGFVFGHDQLDEETIIAELALMAAGLSKLEK